MDNFRKFARVMGIVVATVTAVGILTNLEDIKRYIRLSRM
jgi:hypothetical protein